MTQIIRLKFSLHFQRGVVKLSSAHLKVVSKMESGKLVVEIYYFIVIS